MTVVNQCLTKEITKMSTTFKNITGRFEDFSNCVVKNPTESFPTPKYNNNNLSLTSFYGGIERGRCLQITISEGIGYTQLTRIQVVELKFAIDQWLDGESLVDTD